MSLKVFAVASNGNKECVPFKENVGDRLMKIRIGWNKLSPNHSYLLNSEANNISIGVNEEPRFDLYEPYSFEINTFDSDNLVSSQKFDLFKDNIFACIRRSNKPIIMNIQGGYAVEKTTPNSMTRVVAIYQAGLDAISLIGNTTTFTVGKNATENQFSAKIINGGYLRWFYAYEIGSDMSITSSISDRLYFPRQTSSAVSAQPQMNIIFAVIAIIILIVLLFYIINSKQRRN